MKQNKLWLVFILLSVFVTGCRSNYDWAVIFIRKGHVYMKEKDFSRALVEFQKALRIDPKNENAYLGSADAYLALNKCEVAVENINEASVLNPNIAADYYFKKGECLMLRRKPDDLMGAIKEGYNYAINKDATRAVYFYKRGLAYRELGDEEAAQRDLQQAQQMGQR